MAAQNSQTVKFLTLPCMKIIYCLFMHVLYILLDVMFVILGMNKFIRHNVKNYYCHNTARTILYTSLCCNVLNLAGIASTWNYSLAKLAARHFEEFIYF